MSICRVCGVDVAEPKRGRKPQYCGTRCRVAAHRERARVADYLAHVDELDVVPRSGWSLPVELTSRPRWVRHKNKRPMAVGGWWCSVTDPSHWSSYSDAVGSSAGDGLGFVLNGDGLVCIDLDHVVADGVTDPLADAFIDALGDSYVEYSPSGNGLHVWGFSDIVDKGSVLAGGALKVEIYPSGRFITVTGRKYHRSQDTLGVLNIVNALRLVA
jgi:primase-polymerase (primpol)-like protein